MELNEMGLTAGWAITSLCNLECRHCYVEEKKTSKGLELKELLKIADKLSDFGVTAVNFGGGEPPLRKDLRVLAEYLKDSLKIRLSLTTNGTTYELYRNFAHLFDDVSVSIDFPDKERHNDFRTKGRIDVFSKATNTIEKLGRLEPDINVEMNTCLMSVNSSESDLNDLYELAKKLGVKYWRLNRYQAVGSEEKVGNLRLTPQKFQAACEILAKYTNYDMSSDPVFSSFVGNGAACPCGKTSFRIRQNGEVTPCVFLNLPSGNVLYQDLEQIYNSKNFRDLRERDTKSDCGECKHYEKCSGGCGAATYLAYSDFNHKDPLCWGFTSLSRPAEANENVHKRYLCTIYIPIGD